MLLYRCKFLFIILLLCFNWCDFSKAHSHRRIKRHLHTSKNSIPQKDVPFPKLERQEVEHGAENASQGDSATIHGEADAAAHKFSLGAERLEAASNDAAAQRDGDAGATTRQEEEHEIAERLENLAQGSRRVSAGEGDPKKSTPKKKEEESKTTEKTEQQAEEETEDKAGEEENPEDNPEGKWTVGPETPEEKEEREKEEKEQAVKGYKDWVSGE